MDQLTQRTTRATHSSAGLSASPAPTLPRWHLHLRPEARFGDGWLMAQGFAIAWMGWQWDVPEEPGRLRLRAPVATDRGRAITGLVRAAVIVESHAGLPDRARASGTTPKMFHVFGAYEYRNRAASLVHTEPSGDGRALGLGRERRSVEVGRRGAAAQRAAGESRSTAAASRNSAPTISAIRRSPA